MEVHVGNCCRVIWIDLTPRLLDHIHDRATLAIQILQLLSELCELLRDSRWVSSAHPIIQVCVLLLPNIELGLHDLVVVGLDLEKYGVEVNSHLGC